MLLAGRLCGRKGGVWPVSFSGSPAQLFGECTVVLKTVVLHTQLTNSSWQVALSSDCLSTVSVCLLSSALIAAASVVSPVI